MAPNSYAVKSGEPGSISTTGTGSAGGYDQPTATSALTSTGLAQQQQQQQQQRLVSLGRIKLSQQLLRLHSLQQ
jgi:hypothetical protein